VDEEPKDVGNRGVTVEEDPRIVEALKMQTKGVSTMEDLFMRGSP